MTIQNVELGLYIDFPTYEKLELSEWADAVDAMKSLEEGAISNITEQRQVGHYWLRNPDLAADRERDAIYDTFASITDLEQQLQSQQFTTLLMVGIGGSALGPQFLVDALPPTDNGLSIRFLDNTDPDGFDVVLQSMVPQKTVVAVVSKSGGTKETRNAMLEVEAWYARNQLDFSKYAIAITVEGSKLDKMAESSGWITRLHLWNWVGGRTSITGVVGLLPLIFLNRDWRAFLEGAKLMDDWTRPLQLDNPALQMANLWFLEGKGQGERNMVVLPYKDALGLFGKYLQQLIMESIGKRFDREGNIVSQGLTVYGNKGSTDQHAFVQQLRDGRHDFFTVLIGVLEDRRNHLPKVLVEDDIGAGEYLLGFLLGTRHALMEAGRTVSTLVLNNLNEKSIGALVALFERAVGLYAERLNINAYDQPGVEAGKRAAAEMLELRSRILRGDDVEAADPFDVWMWTKHQQINASQ